MSESTVLSGVSVSLSAWHTDTAMDEGRHHHIWHVTAWWRAVPRRDARVLHQMLKGVLSVWEGGDLPAELWAAEDLATAIMRLVPECVGVDISRAEGYHVQVRA